MSSQFSEVQLQKEINVLEIHLKNWAFKSLLTLKGYYMKNNMKDDLQRLELLGQDIFSLEFMKKYLPEFKIDSLLFYLKNLKKTVKYILSK
jgi:hypothetical protein